MKIHAGLKPSHYDLRIEPNLETATFDGSVTIKIELHEPTSSITLNVHKLTLRSTGLYDASGDPVKIAHTLPDTTLQTFQIVLEHALPASTRIFLYQTFSGLLDKTGVGFHITEGSDSPMASTFLEPMHARTIFPCFDTPNFKTTFSLTLVVPGHLTCLFNTPILSESKTTWTSVASREKKKIEFHRTPLIPTYLLAFAVGDFNMIETHDFRIPIRAYAPRNYEIEDCRFVLDIAVRALTIFEQMFRLDCGLTKLDILVVPGSVGAMENWGLITISTAVVFIGSDSTAAEKLSCAQLITHELAHQYCGNLVTVPSWDYFWFKEALADWAETTVQEVISGPGYMPWEDFVADKMQKALLFDSSRFSHPLEIPIANSQKTPYLDYLTYGKGCAVLRMIEGFVGKDVFLYGVRNFLQNNAYGNPGPDDLWDILSELSGSDIRIMAKTWTQTPGYPVINVEENEADGIITVTQAPFLLSGAKEIILHPLFLEILTRNGIIKKHLNEKSKTVRVPFDFYELNARQMGFYRVAYPVPRLQKLGNEVSKGSLPVEYRIGLISDTAALAFAGHPNVRTSDFLSLLQNFEDEVNFYVWKVIVSALREISKSLLFEDQAIRDAFIGFHKHAVKRCLYRKGSFDTSDDMDDQRFKALMFGNSGGDEKIVAAAGIMFEKFIEGDEKALIPNIRAEVFEIVLKRGGKKEYNQLFAKLSTSTGSTRKDIWRCLGFSQNTTCIKKTLKLATSPEVMANLGLRSAAESLATHKKGIYALWRFVATGTWCKVTGLTFEKVAPVGEMILGCLSKLEYIEGARKYLQSVNSNTLGIEAEKCFESIEARAKWLERDREDLIGWLRSNGYYKHAPTRIQKSMSSIKDVMEYLGCI